MIDEKALKSVQDFYKNRDFSWTDVSDIIIRYESAKAAKPAADEVERLDAIIRKYHPHLEGKRACAGEILHEFAAMRPAVDEVERVAIALANLNTDGHWQLHELNKIKQDILRDEARTAISAMRPAVDEEKIRKIFLKAFRGQTKGALNGNILKRINIALQAISPYLRQPDVYNNSPKTLQSDKAAVIEKMARGIQKRMPLLDEWTHSELATAAYEAEHG